jgi:RHS repeat-associated protein
LITTDAASNPSGTTAQEQLTLPFGAAFTETPAASGVTSGGTNRRFTSYDRSPTTTGTGLDYAVNRHYDSQQGRFTQVDPAGMNATSLGSPQTLNLYAYCANDPINHVDPSGLGVFSFLKRVFNGIAKFIAKVLTNKWVLLVAGIALGVLAGFGFYFAATITTQFYLGAAITLAAMSAILIVGAFHQNFLRVIKAIGGLVASVRGFGDLIRSIKSTINGSVFGTPSWNPNARPGFSLQGEEVPDDGILRFKIWAPKWRNSLAGLVVAYAANIGNAINTFFTGHNAIDAVTVNGDSITVSQHQPRQGNLCEGLQEPGSTMGGLGAARTFKQALGTPRSGLPVSPTQSIGSRALPALGGVGALGPDVGKYVQYHNCVEYLAQCNLNPGSCR